MSPHPGRTRFGGFRAEQTDARIKYTTLGTSSHPSSRGRILQAHEMTEAHGFSQQA